MELNLLYSTPLNPNGPLVVINCECHFYTNLSFSLSYLVPSKANLVHRTIIDCPVCDWCKQEPATTLHALWSCQELDVVWEDEVLWACRRSVTFLNFKELLSWLIKKQNHLELFSITTWSIWTQRNQVRLHQLSYSPHQIASTAKDTLAEFVSVQPAPRSHPPRTRDQWRPPTLDMIKIIFDGAIFNKEPKSGIGVVLHDVHCSLLAFLSRQLSQVYSPLEIEAKAASSALQFAVNLGFNQAVLEGDSQVLMTALVNNNMFLSSWFAY